MKYMTKIDIDQSLITVVMSIDKCLVPGPLEELQKRRFQTIKPWELLSVEYRGNSQGNLTEVQARGQKEPGFNL